MPRLAGPGHDGQCERWRGHDGPSGSGPGAPLQGLGHGDIISAAAHGDNVPATEIKHEFCFAALPGGQLGRGIYGGRRGASTAGVARKTFFRTSLIATQNAIFWQSVISLLRGQRPVRILTSSPPGLIRAMMRARTRQHTNERLVGLSTQDQHSPEKTSVDNFWTAARCREASTRTAPPACTSQSSRPGRPARPGFVRLGLHLTALRLCCSAACELRAASVL